MNTKRRFQQTGMVDQETVDQYQERYEHKRQEVQRDAQRLQDSIRSLATSGLIAVGAVVVLVAFMTALLGNLHQYLETASAFMKFLLNWFVPGVGCAFALWCIVRLYRAFKAWRFDRLDLKRGQAEIDAMNAATNRENLLADAEYAVRMAEAAERTARAQQLSMTLPVDDQGNALYRDPYTGLVTPYIMQMREHPNLSSYHQSQKNDNTLQPGQQQAALPAATGKPTVEEMARLIEHNSLNVALGRSRTATNPENQYIISELQDSHLKIIGGSRMGKSCGAGGILRQVELTHDPRRLSFALLDLENKTSRLFENSEHLITIGGRRERAIHARTIEEVPVYLHYLADELEKRDRMTYAQVEDRPHILVYLEEFLNLKRQLKANYPKLYPTFLVDFNTLATRGLKLGLHLMACAQVDYADEEMRESMNQFMGLNMAYGVRPQAAMAAGFVNTELLNQNYANRKPGQFVIESFSGADIGDAPEFDVRGKVKALEEAKRVTLREEKPYEISEKSTQRNSLETGRNELRNGPRNEPDAGLQAYLREKMLEVINYTRENQSATTTDIIKAVWQVKPGDNDPYRQAKDEYAEVQRMITDLAMRGMSQGDK